MAYVPHSLKAKSFNSVTAMVPGTVLTIHEPVDYMARAVMILMQGKDITWAVGRVGL